MSDHEAGRTTEGVSELLRADQRTRWLRGDRPPAEDYLARQPGLNADAALDLIYNEYVLREGLGEKPAAAEFIRRFPQYKDQLQRLFDLDHALLADSHPDSTGATMAQTVPPAVAEADAVPRAVGKYLVVAPLGRGGQADVYRAVHPGLRKDVVVKVSREPLSDDGGRDHLQEEGRILAELEHPALARVYDLDVDGGRAFLVMEYIAGRNLEQYAAEEKPSPARAAELTARVARGLAFAHRRGVLHLDVKPRNIVVDESGRPRLIDFGLSRLRHAWSADPAESGVTGTPAFMAPEQARAEADRFGPRTDVFGLGGMLYFLLTGSPPYRGAGFMETLEAARVGAWDRERLAAAKAPRRLRAVCERALAADPANRYAGADDMAAALKAFARPTRRAVLIGAAGLIGAGAAGALAWTYWGARRPDAPPVEPEHAAVSNPVPAPRLKVSVWRNGRFHALADSTPLKTGDELRVEINAPADAYAALFLFTGAGAVKLLRQDAPSGGDRLLRYPPEEDGTTELTGPPGTEFVLACGRRSGPVAEEEIRTAWDGTGAWPALPGDAVLCVDRDRVWEAQAGRDFGPTHGHVTPEAEVKRRLEALRGRLRDSFDFLSGMAFAHRE